VYTVGDSTPGEGIVTIVDAGPATASAAVVRAVAARLPAVLDDGVAVGARLAVNDDKGVMGAVPSFPVDEDGRLRDDRFQSV
jgi:thioredoxin reductase